MASVSGGTLLTKPLESNNNLHIETTYAANITHNATIDASFRVIIGTNVGLLLGRHWYTNNRDAGDLKLHSAHYDITERSETRSASNTSFQLAKCYL